MDSINNAPNLGGDAWLELQAFKTRQINRREKLNRHKDLINGISGSGLSLAHLSGSTSSNLNNNNTSNTSTNTSNEIDADHLVNTRIIASDQAHTRLSDPGADFVIDPQEQNDDLNNKSDQSRILNLSDSLTASDRSDRYCDYSSDSPSNRTNHRTLIDVECLLLLKLCDVALKLPIDSRNLLRSIKKVRGFETTTLAIVENLLQKFAHQELIIIEEPSTAVLSRGKIAPGQDHDEMCTYVISADHTKLVEFNKAFSTSDSIRALLSDEYHGQNSQDDPDLFTTRSSQNRDKIRTSFNETQSNAKIPPRSSTRSSHDAQSSHRYDHEQAQYSSQRISSDAPRRRPTAGDDVESLLSLSSTRERENKKLGEELLELLSKPTAKERNLLERFRSADGYQVQEFCPKGTKDECRRNGDGVQACDKLHFKKILAKHTEESLGDCSFLNTCFHMDSCKYVHYEVDYDDKQSKQDKKPMTKQPSSSISKGGNALCMPENNNSCRLTLAGNGKSINDKIKPPSNNLGLKQVSSSRQVSKFSLSAEEQAQIDVRNRKRFKTVLYPPQWIQCDLRYFDMSLLGKFSVVMADPPWDIHMELPYGTMSDDEMRKLNVPALQDEGVIFLWVTGRAMELGRECLALWGYERCDEIIWVKTNQLQRIIRTGRTGHWLNHGKEHCLVGIKGNPSDMNRGLDCDIIVAEVRATSHKPDEIYGIIERLSPGTRKIELFGRAHNVQPNWITLGNQLDGVRLVEPSLIEAFKKQNLPYQTGD